jgi:hypothetical protein
MQGRNRRQEDSSVSAFLLGKAQQSQRPSKSNNKIPCQSEIQPTNILLILKMLSLGQHSSSLLNLNSYPNDN